MRIGMLADIYKPHISGVTHAISANKRLLEEWGHEVFVFTFGDPDFVDAEERVVRSPGLPLVDTGFYFSFRYSAEAVELLRTMDIVHVHHPFLSGRLALRYCRSQGIPIVFTNHTRYDLYAQAYLPLLPDALGDAFLQAYLPTFCRAVDLVISPSAGMAEILRGLGVDAQIKVIPNGVDLSLFRAEVKPLERSLVGFSEQDTLLIYAGRVAPEKNLEFLVQAFAGVARTFDRVKLLVVGDGPYRENMQELVRGLGLNKQVVFTGMVPHEQLPGYLSAGDAFVTASVSEVHPLSVIEALACGLPVLGIELARCGRYGAGWRKWLSLGRAPGDLHGQDGAPGVRAAAPPGDAAGCQALFGTICARTHRSHGVRAIRGVAEPQKRPSAQLFARDAHSARGRPAVKTSRQRLGRWGEDLAGRYLEERGYSILERNVRTAYGELDLVARKEDVLVFVEVKTRTSESFGLPEVSVTEQKQAHILNAAQDFMQRHPELEGDWRVDVIAILGAPGREPAQVEHFENAFS